jgi:hypothetical protein
MLFKSVAIHNESKLFRFDAVPVPSVLFRSRFVSLPSNSFAHRGYSTPSQRDACLFDSFPQRFGALLRLAFSPQNYALLLPCLSGDSGKQIGGRNAKRCRNNQQLTKRELFGMLESLCRGRSGKVDL